MASPHIVLDSEMVDTLQENGHLYDFAFDSPGQLFGGDGATDLSFQSPVPSKARKIHADSGPGRHGSTVSASSDSSMHDSSSDSSGRYKRKTSSRSPGSAHPVDKNHLRSGRDSLNPASANMAFSTDFAANLQGQTPNFDFNHQAMENDFDFESAASSPSPLLSANGGFSAPKRIAMPFKDSPGSSHLALPSRSSVGTRDSSPLSVGNNGMNQAPMFTHSHMSPASSNEEYIDHNLGTFEQINSFDFNQALQSFENPQQLQDMMLGQGILPQQQNGGLPSTLYIHPTPQKSRVETQIPIKMSLWPVPQGATKLHLPSHTISKPKLLAKPPYTPSPDTLELHTSLVCFSAMRDSKKRQRALARAARPAVKAEEGEAESENEPPLEGGEVQICAGCIVRERKRAARKKSKKPEEEEPWQRDEAKRVIVFNTNEIKDWLDPSYPAGQDANPDGKARGEAPEMNVPDYAKQIDVPMRIACYCRHQGEKMGFQVIFTIKDFRGKLIAQSMSKPIVITDDHKTHAPPQTYNQERPMSNNNRAQDDAAFMGNAFGGAGDGLFRNQSSSDLTSLRNFAAGLNPASGAGFAVPQVTSRTSSSTMTPHNLSRQASPASQGSSSYKKRKASGGGSVQIPASLQMTKINGGQQAATQGQTWNQGYVTSPGNPSNFGLFGNMQGAGQIQPNMAQYLNGQLPSPANETMPFAQGNRSQSFDNLGALGQSFSLPNSHQGSRAASPASALQQLNSAGLTMPPDAMHSAFGSIQAAGTAKQPTIHKLIPSEGPKSGGIEVTCLGSGFYQGLEVMFGGTTATTTTYWGETSLVCLLPAAQRAGTVPVSFKHQYHQQSQMPLFNGQAASKQQIFFRYFDDDEQELLRQALMIVHQKMTGGLEDAGEIARRIVNGTSGDSGSWSGMGSGSNETHRQAAALQACVMHGQDCETAVLRCLELMDRDDSDFEPEIDLERSNGQSILHIASSLGYSRLVSNLLARGANPNLMDKNGLSPMHMAALNGNKRVARKLQSGGGDPFMRSYLGFTPLDMASAIEHTGPSQNPGHSRSKSVEAVTGLIRDLQINKSSSSKKQERNGAHLDAQDGDSSSDETETENSEAKGGWTDKVANQIQQALPNIPVQPQAVVRRLSSLVPQRFSQSLDAFEQKLSSSFESTGSSPPRYDEIYPSGSGITPSEKDAKMSSATRAAMDTYADQKCAELFDQASSSGSSSKAYRFGKMTLTAEEREELKRAHARKLKNLDDDRKLYTIWIPLAFALVLAALGNLLPGLSLKPVLQRFAQTLQA